MSIPESILGRLNMQLEALGMILAGATPETLEARPVPSEWSARENLAHLARHAEVFLARIARIRQEERPVLARYLAEEDPEWAEWSRLPLSEVLRRLREARARLLAWIRSLSPEEANRTGIHPAFGEMSVAGWLDFFLLHEAHHMYVAMVRLAEARLKPS